MSYERTQHGNPHGLTINQHVLPKESIARFSQKDGFVSVFLLKQKKTFRLSPKDALFCAMRVWNQASEHGFMRKVEDDFQALANDILSDRIDCNFCPSENLIISHFHALCRMRAEARQTPHPDVQIQGVAPGSALTKDQEEVLEKNGYIFPRGTTIPGRHIESLRIQMLFARLCAPETTWAVVYSRMIEFLVPDSFREIGIVPLAPNCCLVANQIGGEISPDNAIRINRIAVAHSSTYYFARDFTKCGV